MKIVTSLGKPSIHVPHSETFECGICDCNMKTLEDLDIHLFSCEVYKCASNDDLECECKVKTLGEIRNHIETNHKHLHFIHMKLNRNDANEVTVKKYWYDSKGKVK